MNSKLIIVFLLSLASALELCLGYVDDVHNDDNDDDLENTYDGPLHHGVRKGAIDMKGAKKFIKRCEKYHNKLRALHPVGKLETGVKHLRKDAKRRIKLIYKNYGGVLTHPEELDHPYGENLLQWPVSGGSYNFSQDDCKQWMSVWYDEIESYDFEKPGFSSGTGHFTQLVWNSTSKVGCAVRSGLKGLGEGPNVIVACEYEPPGNVDGSYEENVFPPIKRTLKKKIFQNRFKMVYQGGISNRTNLIDYSDGKITVVVV